MLVRRHNGGVDDQVFKVRILAELGEKALPNALFCPSPETPEYAVPIAKLFGQVAPTSGSMRFHCASGSFRRIKIALLSCDLESHSRVRGNPLNVHRT
jgi:hypothetical protein